jgi:hypothetical protein
MYIRTLSFSQKDSFSRLYYFVSKSSFSVVLRLSSFLVSRRSSSLVVLRLSSSFVLRRSSLSRLVPCLYVVPCPVGTFPKFPS